MPELMAQSRGDRLSPAARMARTAAERRLSARCAAGDRRARDELIQRFLPLAHSVARRYHHSHSEPLEDLVQVASLALVKAVDRFDPSLGHAFTSFAVPTMIGEIKRHFRDRTWALRPPRAVQERTLRLDAATKRLSQQLGRPPTVRELGRATGDSDEEVLEGLRARSARTFLSLQALAGSDDAEGAPREHLGAADGGYAEAEHRVMLDALLAFLPPFHRVVLRLRFEHDLTQAEIGALLNVSQIHVSRALSHATHRLHTVVQQQQMLDERRSAAAVRRARAQVR
jgi:RNA polymerase sigma-B factor